MANDQFDNNDEGEEKEKSPIGEALKKVFSAGVSAAFMTEEGIRTYLGDLKLPKEVLNIIVQTAGKSKDEITNRVTKEIVGIVSKIDFVKEMAKFAETHKFKIQAEIDIVKKDKT
jgi:hypothetical protein